nr:AAA family ATPase [Nesterenkonia xinjiangensis]
MTVLRNQYPKSHGLIRDILDGLPHEQRQAVETTHRSYLRTVERRHGDVPDDVGPHLWNAALATVLGGREDVADPVALDEQVHAARVRQQVSSLRAREDARRALAAEQAAETTIPAPAGLDAFIHDHADEETAWRVEDLWPRGGRVLLAAPPKAGKTTLMANLLRSLADGDPLLDRFGVEPAEAGVTLIDTEMGRGQLARWLAAQRIHNAEHVRVLSLRGDLSRFNVLDPATRTRWARALEGSQVVVLDNLRPVLDALGLDENREAGRFLTSWDELMAEAGADESLIVTHTGHNSERARGDSALLASNDAMWTLVRAEADNPASDRYFKAYGREVDFPEALIEFNDGALRIAGGSRKQHRITGKLEQLRDRVLEHLSDAEGWQSKRLIEKSIAGDNNLIRQALDEHVATGRVVARPRQGRGGGKEYALPAKT